MAGTLTADCFGGNQDGLGVNNSFPFGGVTKQLIVGIQSIGTLGDLPNVPGHGTAAESAECPGPVSVIVGEALFAFFSSRLSFYPNESPRDKARSAWTQMDALKWGGNRTLYPRPPSTPPRQLREDIR
ncbi:hypothetical protein J6590_022542 [Homalodisca vitripennis]|nr:hypothetical protein J6590_022542 [Homalodisca vitripennis]